MADVLDETTVASPELQVSSTGAGALRDVNCVLRIPHLPEHVESQATDDETMIINMGPQHPSTHGVLRVMMEL